MVQADGTLLQKSEADEAKQVKSVAQWVACMYAIGGVFLLLLTLRFVGELLGVVSGDHTDDNTFVGCLVSLLHRAGPFTGDLLCALLSGGMTFLIFAQVYGLWRLKKWSLYVTIVSTFLLFVFVLFSVATDPNVAPFIGLVSLGSGLFLAYLRSVRKHFSN